MSDDADNVVTLSFGKAPGSRIKRAAGTCFHRSYLVDDNARTVECEACGAIMDPFKILLDFAYQRRSIDFSKQEEKKIRDRVNELLEQEKKIKARTRSASKKDADMAVAAERKKTEEQRARLAWYARELEEIAGKIQRIATVKVKR